MAPPETKKSSSSTAKRTAQQTSLNSFFTTTNKKRKQDEALSSEAPTTITTHQQPLLHESVHDSRAPAAAPAASDLVESSSSSSTALSAAAATTGTAYEMNTNDSSEPIIPYALTPPIPVDKNSKWMVYQNACLVRVLVDNNTNDSTRRRTKVAGLDLDGTLLNWRIAGWPSRMEHYELWNASVISKLRHLYDVDQYQLIVFSNQGAVRGAFHGKKAAFVKSLIEWLAVTIDRPLQAVMSTNKKLGFHKPSPTMWGVAQELCCSKGVVLDVVTSFFVGDSVGGDGDPQGGVDVGFAKCVGDMFGSKNSSSYSSDDGKQQASPAAKQPVSLLFYTPTALFGPSAQELRARRQQHASYESPSAQVLQTRAALVSGYVTGPIMLLLCGAQGSGKSTFCQQLLLENADHWVHLSQDTIHNGKPGKREQVEHAAAVVLRAQKSVVIDRMHLDDTQRAPFIQVAQAARVPVHAVVLTPPTDVLAHRVRHRQHHPVQGESGAKLAVSSASKLQLPSYQEGIDLWSTTSSVEGAGRFVQLYRDVHVTATSAESATTTNKSKHDDDATTTTTSFTGVNIPKNLRITNDEAISSMALGTMGLGRKVAAQVVATAYQLGFRAFDTAPTYKNEDKVGEGLPRRKANNIDVGNMNHSDTSSCFVIVKVPKRATTGQQVRHEFTVSLSNLQCKTVNLLLLHWPSDVMTDSSTLAAVWKEMEALVQESLVQMLGVCNFTPAALSILLTHCKTVRPVVNQVERHPLLQQWELVDFCAKNDILLQAHTCLGQGKSELLEHGVVQQVVAASNNKFSSPAQVVLQWNLQQGVAVVPKCSSEEHMRQALSLLSSADKMLSPSGMKMLNEMGENKRFVTPPFMYGTAPFCWGKDAPK